uniref:Uncharacterized protein n=1 Tax=Romanomermis culicivorax TaxID=13658 RepID=A0A915L2M1_ROMCU
MDGAASNILLEDVHIVHFFQTNPNTKRWYRAVLRDAGRRRLLVWIEQPAPRGAPWYSAVKYDRAFTLASVLLWSVGRCKATPTDQ